MRSFLLAPFPRTGTRSNDYCTCFISVCSRAGPGGLLILHTSKTPISRNDPWDDFFQIVYVCMLLQASLVSLALHNVSIAAISSSLLRGFASRLTKSSEACQTSSIRFRSGDLQY